MFYSVFLKEKNCRNRWSILSLKKHSRSGIYTRTLVALTIFNQGDKDRASSLVKELIREYDKNREKIIGNKENQWDTDPVETIASLITATSRTGASQSILESLSADSYFFA